MVFPVQFKFRESSDATRRSCLASTQKVGGTRGIVIVEEIIERDRRKCRRKQSTKQLGEGCLTVL